jgi:hypothetical protein
VINAEPSNHEFADLMSAERGFLNNLVGRWKLSGKMGAINLQQDVTARWILNDTFVLMHCRSNTPHDNPIADYEAIYQRDGVQTTFATKRLTRITADDDRWYGDE